MSVDRHLILLRHAKSDWPPGVPDRARPLGQRGRTEAPQAGRWLAASGLAPDLALVSSALRAQQTWNLVQAQLAAEVPTRIEDALYETGVAGILDLLQTLEESVATALVVGHNPATENLALLLEDGSGPTEERERMAGKYPTSAIAVLQLQVPTWADLDEDTARLVSFTVPR